MRYSVSLQMPQKNPASASRQPQNGLLKEGLFLHFLASSEAVLRLRPEFLGGMDSPWVDTHFIFWVCWAEIKAEQMTAVRGLLPRIIRPTTVSTVMQNDFRRSTLCIWSDKMFERLQIWNLLMDFFVLGLKLTSNILTLNFQICKT